MTISALTTGPDLFQQMQSQPVLQQCVWQNNHKAKEMIETFLYSQYHTRRRTADGIQKHKEAYQSLESQQT